MENWLNATELALSLDVVLEQIFSYLPTKNLLFQINRVNRKFNEISRKLLLRKRSVFLTNKNIFLYCDLINNGGDGHQNIHLDLNLRRFHPRLNESRAHTIIFAYSKFGSFVKELNLHFDWKDNFSAVPIELDLFHQILLCSPNILHLSLEIENSSPPEILHLSNIGPFNSLKTLNLSMSRDWGLIQNFLEKSPNIENIGLDGDSFDVILEELEIFEQNYQTIIQKSPCLYFHNLDVALGDFLIRKDFSSLRKLELGKALELQTLGLVLNKYGNQLVELYLNLGNIDRNDGDWIQPVFILPEMKNLEKLTLDYLAIGEDLRWPVFKFWHCLGNHKNRNIPKLVNFSLLIEREENEVIYNIFSTIFDDVPNHPIFPGVENISGEIPGRLLTGIRTQRLELWQRMKNYFPNFV